MTTSGLLNLKSGDATLADIDTTTSPSAITVTTLTVNTSIVPDASGGADLGSATLELGDVYIADDKQIKFGSDQDATIEYDETTLNALKIVGEVVFADGTTDVDIASHDTSNGLKLGGTLVTATAAELNILDGVTSTAAELNILDGVVATAAELNQKELHYQLTLGTARTDYIVIPYANADVTAIYSVIQEALTTGDETLTFKDNGGTGLTGGVITITQAASAAGDVDSVTPSANNSFTAGQKLIVDVGGENGTAARCDVTVVLTLT